MDEQEWLTSNHPEDGVGPEFRTGRYRPKTPTSERPVLLSEVPASPSWRPRLDGPGGSAASSRVIVSPILAEASEGGLPDEVEQPWGRGGRLRGHGLLPRGKSRVICSVRPHSSGGKKKNVLGLDKGQKDGSNPWWLGRRKVAGWLCGEGMAGLARAARSNLDEANLPMRALQSGQ
jgi:hypothetical protein